MRTRCRMGTASQRELASGKNKFLSLSPKTLNLTTDNTDQKSSILNHKSLSSVFSVVRFAFLGRATFLSSGDSQI